MTTAWPVMKAQSSDARNRSAPMRSSGTWSRLDGPARQHRRLKLRQHLLVVDDALAEDESRRQGVDADAVTAKLARHAARHGQHRPLGDHVVEKVRCPLEYRARRDVDDAAPLVAPHLRHHGLGAQEHAAHVDGHQPVPLLDGDFGERLHLQRGEHGGVGDQDVDLAEALHGGPHHAVDGGFVGHVGGEGDGLAALLLDHLGRPALHPAGRRPPPWRRRRPGPWHRPPRCPARRQ